MATRFYLSGTAAAAVAPAFDAEWERTATAVRREISPTKSASALTTISHVADISDAAPLQILTYQGVSAPLAAQTIAGSLTGVILCNASVSTTHVTAVKVRVVSNDGATVRGTPLVLTMDDLVLLEYNAATGGSRRFFPGTTSAGQVLSSLAIQDGDRLVVEFGAQHPAPGSPRTVWMHFKDDAASDLVLAEAGANGVGFFDGTTTPTLANSPNPWIEFSQTLSFYTAPTPTADSTLDARSRRRAAS